MARDDALLVGRKDEDRQGRRGAFDPLAVRGVGPLVQLGSQPFAAGNNVAATITQVVPGTIVNSFSGPPDGARTTYPCGLSIGLLRSVPAFSVGHDPTR